MNKPFMEIPDFLTREEYHLYSTYCCGRRGQIENLTPDPEWGDNGHMLASRHREYNIFDFWEFAPLLDKIKEHLPKEILNEEYCIHGFINWQEAFESLGRHSHDSYMTGHVTIQGNSGQTCYQSEEGVVKTSPSPGSLYLIGHEVPHWVEENISTTDRISIAFSIRKYGEEERPTTKI
jgi:hypothetical protein